jgi:transmembrane sensor
MNLNRLTYLYQRYIADACTHEELQEFKNLVKQNADNPELIQLMDDSWDTLSETDIQNSDRRADHIYDHIINQSQTVKNNNKLWFKIAASVMLFISVSLVLHGIYSGGNKPVAVADKNLPLVVLPGSSKAVLTLANGKKVELNEKIKGEVAVQSNTVIHKTTGGQLVYTTNPASQSAAANVLNTLTVPTGGQYDIVLADGTKVFLNSESSLTYPASFTGNQRNVTLTGEAYFEVAKNAAMPFKVNVAGKQQVEVLGTHFNIMAYANDDHIKTTLLEGSVRLSLPGYQTILKSGQVAYHDLNTSAVAVQPADIDEAIAWKNGYFKFHHQDIKSIMKKITRWYNVEVAYNGNITSHTFGGIYLRNRELSELLKGLENTGLVHFKTEGRRVTVMP